MELLDHTRLQGRRQWLLAQMFLSFIGHGYIWQEGDNNVPKVDQTFHKLHEHKTISSNWICFSTVWLLNELNIEQYRKMESIVYAIAIMLRVVDSSAAGYTVVRGQSTAGRTSHRIPVQHISQQLATHWSRQVCRRLYWCITKRQ